MDISGSCLTRSCLDDEFMKFAELIAVDGFCFWRLFAVKYPFSCSNADLKVSSSVAPGLMQSSLCMSENPIFR